MIGVRAHHGALRRVTGLGLAHDPLQGEHVRAGHVGGEVGDVVVGRGAHHLVGGPDLHQRTVAQDHDPVPELERLGEVVGDEHHRLADLVVQPDDLVLHVAPDQGVECGERLVEEQHRRVTGQGPGQADALLHAAGELVGIAALEPGEPDEVDDLARLGAALLLAHATDLEAVGNVVDHLAVGQEAEVLEHHGDLVTPELAQLGLRCAGDLFVADPHRARRRLDQPGQAPHERRLARAGQAHHHEDLARGDLEAHVLDADHAPGLLLQVRAGEVGIGGADDLVRTWSEDLPQVLHRETGAGLGGVAGPIGRGARRCSHGVSSP